MSEMTSNQPARERHWVYGFNAALLVAIGAVVLGFVFYFASRSAGSAWATYDWSSNGVNSLSGSTQKLLKEIDAGTATYRIYSVIPSRNDVERRENLNIEQDQHRREMLDLLQQYARRSKKITVEDFGDRSSEEILQEMVRTYDPEIKPYKEAIEAFDPMAEKLMAFFSEQAIAIGAKGQAPDATPEQLENVAQIQAFFKRLPELFQNLKKEIADARQTTIPHWGAIEQELAEKLSDDRLLGFFALMGNKDQLKKLPPLPAPLLAYLNDNADKFKDVHDQLQKYVDTLTKLKPLTSESILESLRTNSVVVLGPTTAKVLNSSDLYSQKGRDQPRVFNGEQAISSALLAMVRPEKVKVVLVGFGRSVSAYSEAEDVLKAANFETLEWSPPAPQMPGSPPPQDPTDPPASGKGVVWIVAPPEPDMQMMQMGMPGGANAQPILDATRKHMADGGQVLFLAESAAAKPEYGIMGSPFPYADLVKPFGIDVMSRYTVVTENSGRDEQGREVHVAYPRARIVRFEEHPITSQMQGLPLLLSMSRATQMLSLPTVVGLMNPLPEGAVAQVIAKTEGSDTWGETDWAPDATYTPGKDMPSPMPVAAVSVRNRGQKDAEQRVAVIGSKQFACDDLMDAAQQVSEDEAVLVYPGNRELLKNTVLWLAGYENMIAVSARANQAGRIGDLSPGKLLGVKILVAGMIPALALVIGGAVWMVRRR